MSERRGRRKVVTKKVEVRDKSGKLLSSTMQKTTIFLDKDGNVMPEPPNEGSDSGPSGNVVYTAIQKGTRSTDETTDYKPATVRIPPMVERRRAQSSRVTLPAERSSDQLVPLAPFYRTNPSDFGQNYSEFGNPTILKPSYYFGVSQTEVGSGGRSRSHLDDNWSSVFERGPAEIRPSLFDQIHKPDRLARDIITGIQSERKLNRTSELIIDGRLMQKAKDIAERTLIDQRIRHSEQNVNISICSGHPDPRQVIREWSAEMTNWPKNYFKSHLLWRLGVGIATQGSLLPSRNGVIEPLTVIVAIYE